MAVRSIKVMCVLCGEAHASAELTPVTLPIGITIAVQLEDGTERIFTVSGSPIPVCTSCIGLLQDVNDYKTKLA